MGNSRSKEETVVAQLSVTGNNQATIDQIHSHMNSINIVMIFIGVLLTVALLGVLIYVYRRCQKKWIRDEIARVVFRRSFQQRRQRDPEHLNSGVSKL